MSNGLPALADCPPMRARMTEAACARMWRSAQVAPPAAHEARAHCVGCPLGAVRAGASAAEVAAVQRQQAAALLRRLCPRCERQAARLIARRLCVSCYNRDREAARGRNSKGARPSICKAIYDGALAVDGRVERIARITGQPEAIAVLAARAGPGASFGRPAIAALVCL